MALAVRLRFRSSDGALQGVREATQFPVRIGRNEMNDCQFVHPYVSEFHCLVDVVDGQLCVRDLNSKNGVHGTHSGQFVRMPSAHPVPLSSLGNVFVVGGAVEVRVEATDLNPSLGRRASSVHGMVLGNLDQGERAPSVTPPPPVYGSPPAQPGYGGSSAAGPWGASLPPLPPLSVNGESLGPIGYGGARVAPAAPFGGMSRPPSASTPPPLGDPGGSGHSGVSSFGQSLPGLPALSGAYGAAPVQNAQGREPARGAYGAPLAAAPAGVSRNTQHLSMATEVLALAGLRELASSLVPGVPLETTGDIARLLTKLHDLIEVFCRCFISMRAGHAQFFAPGDHSPSSRSYNRSPSAQRVAAARDPAQLAMALLDWRNHDFDPPQVVESEMIDVVMHHAAMVEGVMRGVEALLEQISPEAIQRAVNEQGGAGKILAPGKTLWKTYQSRFDAVASENKLYELVFGPEFAASYREYRVRQTSAPPPPT